MHHLGRIEKDVEKEKREREMDCIHFEIARNSRASPSLARKGRGEKRLSRNDGDIFTAKLDFLRSLHAASDSHIEER